MKSTSRFLLVALLALLGPSCALTSGSPAASADVPPTLAAFKPERPPLIPMPREISWGDRATRIPVVRMEYPASASDGARNAHFTAEARDLLKARGVAIGASGPLLRFALSSDPWLADKPEGYRLRTTADGALVEARTAAGLFHGLQTLSQLVTRRGDGPWLAHAEVRDHPAFAVRGVMNDTGRNYMPLSMLKEVADVLARYKMNVYHWHLTDNHGWRLESRKHPEVNDSASFDRMPGKYYTQAEFREFVEYCRVRHITVVP